MRAVVVLAFVLLPVAAISGALDAFVRSVALELRRGLKVNMVSPGAAEDSTARYGESFPGYNPVPMARVVNAFVRSVEGGMTGQVFREHG